MLLPNHRRYTGEALKGLRVGKDIRAGILTGVGANDLCEFTEEWRLFVWAKERIRSLLWARKKRVGHLAIWQSHFGNLASMHVMSKTPGEPAATTMAEVRSWFDFLNGLALDSISIDPDATIGSDNTPIDSLFADLHIEYDQLFDSEDIAKIRQRSVGMMLHLIQDSFTPCHCQREDNMEIAEFYCYELQDPGKHRDADDVSASNKEILISECRTCVTGILLRGEPYDCSHILRLRANPDNSGGGPYQ